MRSDTKNYWKVFGFCFAITVGAFVLMGLGGVGPCGPGTLGGMIAMVIAILALIGSGSSLLVAVLSTLIDRSGERAQRGAAAHRLRDPGSASG